MGIFEWIKEIPLKQDWSNQSQPSISAEEFLKEKGIDFGKHGIIETKEGIVELLTEFASRQGKVVEIPTHNKVLEFDFAYIPKLISDEEPPLMKFVPFIDEAGEIVIYRRTEFGYNMRDGLADNSPKDFGLVYWLDKKPEWQIHLQWLEDLKEKESPFTILIEKLLNQSNPCPKNEVEIEKGCEGRNNWTCPKCSHSPELNSNFCPNCGAGIKWL